MPNTYSQIYIHTVFAVHGRGSVIPHSHEEELYKYIAGIIQERQMKSLIVGGMPDHVHILFSLNPSVAISNLMREVKASSSKFINDRQMIEGRFQWQTGYGAFSYSHSQIDSVYNYIARQKEHHRVRTFHEEYMEFLQRFGVSFDERFVSE
ncbi:MAG: IS200/IS605 family transposase [Thermoguttaceae bacterium]